MARAMRLAAILASLAVLTVLAWPGSMRAAPMSPPGGSSGGHPRPVAEGVHAKLVRPGSPFRNRFLYGGRRYGYEYQTPRTYVVAEKRGPEVMWSKFTWTYQVYDKVAHLRAEAEATAKANAEVRKELAQLKSRAGRLKAEAARDADPGKKQQLQTQLTQVEQTIHATETSMRPVVIWVVAGPYNPRHLNDFLLRLEQETGALHVRPAH